ncbi:MAG: LysE family translocator [Deltaproteobacteria bacterium]|nr:LysE family translocator [Deltaproteobacteria bacterium]
MLHYLTIGTILGLSAGFAPGPLLALVISETLRHNMKAGVQVALAPLATDLPIIILTVFILSKLSNFHNVLGIISMVGGFLILVMGYQAIRIKGVEVEIKEEKPKSLTKGMIVNVLNPHPYLFWLSVGAPTIIKATNQSMLGSASFIIGFYFFLVGSKILLAFLVGRSRSFLTRKWYIYMMRGLGFVLCVFAMVLFRDGLRLLNILTISLKS